MKTHMTLGFSAVIASAAGIAAAATFYSDLGTFQAAGMTTVDGFENACSASALHIYPSFTIAETGNRTNFVGAGSPGAISGLGVVSGIGVAVYDDNRSSVLEFSAFSSLFPASGLWITSSEDAMITVAGSVSTTLAATENVAQFFGVTDATGITGIRFDFSSGPDVGVEDVHTGSVSAVPLPVGGFAADRWRWRSDRPAAPQKGISRTDRYTTWVAPDVGGRLFVPHRQTTDARTEHGVTMAQIKPPGLMP